MDFNDSTSKELYVAALYGLSVLNSQCGDFRRGQMDLANRENGFISVLALYSDVAEAIAEAVVSRVDFSEIDFVFEYEYLIPAAKLDRYDNATGGTLLEAVWNMISKTSHTGESEVKQQVFEFCCGYLASLGEGGSVPLKS